jgi:hypothetical protein
MPNDVKREITDEDFDACLHDILTKYDANDMLRIPGVYELVSEEYNNEVLALWQELQADKEAEDVP